jgi:hypothetical protein
MGGSQSAPQILNNEITLPRPGTGSYANGLSVAPGMSSECNGCALLVDPNISSSSAKITRSPAMNPDTKKIDMSRTTKLIIMPSLAFRLRYVDANTQNPLEDKISKIELYHPSPLRVENVQHDAVMVFIGDSGNSRVFVPLVGSSNPQTDFITRVASYLDPLTKGTAPTTDSSGKVVDGPFYNSTTGLFGTVDVPTGNDWTLSKIFSGDPSFFVWQRGDFVQSSQVYKDTESVSNDIVDQVPAYSKGALFDYKGFQYFPKHGTSITIHGWTPVGGQDTRDFFMAEPVSISSNDLAIIRQLPVTSPDSIDLNIANVFHHAGTPRGGCSAVPLVPMRPTIPIELQPVTGGAGPLPSFTLIQIVIGTVAFVLLFTAIYWGIKWGLSNYGDLFKNLGERFGKIFVRRLKKNEPPSDTFSFENPIKKLVPTKFESNFNLLGSPTSKSVLPSSRAIFAPLTPRPMEKQQDKLSEESPFSIENPIKKIASFPSNYDLLGLPKTRRSLPSARNVFGPLKPRPMEKQIEATQKESPVSIELPKISGPSESTRKLIADNEKLVEESKKHVESENKRYEEQEKKDEEERKLENIKDVYLRRAIRGIMKNRNLGFDAAKTYYNRNAAAAYVRGGTRKQKVF